MSGFTIPLTMEMLMKTKMKSNIEKIRAKFNELGGSDNRWLTIKTPERGQETKLQIRVLPPWSESADGFFYYSAGLHYGFSIGGRNRAIPCLETHPNNEGKKCPVCTFIAKLKNSDEDGHSELAQKLRKSIRYWVNVIDREDNNKIKIYGGNKKFIDVILDASEDEDIGDITDPQNGRDIVISRRGSGFQTRYSYRVRAKATPAIFKPEDIYQLDKEVVEWMSYDTIVGYLQDNYLEELTELGIKFKGKKSKDDSESEPVKAKKIIKKKKQVVEQDEDENEDDEDVMGDDTYDEDEDE